MRVTPSVRIERVRSGQWIPLVVDGVTADDQGFRILTLGVEREGRMNWCAHWIPPIGVESDTPLRFAVQTLEGHAVCAEFSLPNSDGAQEATTCR